MQCETLLSHSCGVRPCPHFTASVDSTDVSFPLLSGTVEGLGDLRDGAVTVFLVCRPREKNQGTLLEVSVGIGDALEILTNCHCHEPKREDLPDDGNGMSVEIFAQTVERLTTELATTQHELATVKQELGLSDTMKRQIEKMTEQLSLSVADTETARKQNLSHEIQVEKLSARVSQLEVDCSSERKVSDSLRKQLEDRIAEHSETLIKMHALQDKKHNEQTFAEQLKALCKEGTSLLSECGGLETLAKSVASQKIELLQKVSLLDGSQSHFSETIAALRRDLEDSRAECSDLREKNRGLEISLSNAELQAKEAKKGMETSGSSQRMIQDLETEVAFLRNKVAENSEAAKAEASRFADELNRAEQEIGKLGRELGRVEVELTKTQNKLADQEKSDLEGKELVLRNLAEANCLANSRLEELEILRRSMEAHRQQKKEMEDNFQERLQLVSAECDKVRNASLAAEQRMAESASECGNLRGQVKAGNEKIQGLEILLNDKEKEREELLAKVGVLEQKLSARFSEESKRCEELEADLGKLRLQLSETEQRNLESSLRSQALLEQTMKQGGLELEQERLRLDRKLASVLEEERLKREVLEVNSRSLEAQISSLQAEILSNQKKAHEEARTAALGMEAARKLSNASAEEASSLRSKVNACLGDMEGLRKELTEANSKLETMARAREDLEGKLANANRATQEAHDATERVRESSRRAMEDNERLTLLLRSNEIELDQANARALRSESTVDQLQAELRSLSVKIGVLEERAQRDAHEFKRHTAMLDAAHRDAETLSSRNVQLEQEVRKLSAMKEGIAVGSKDAMETMRRQLEEKEGLLEEAKKKLKEEREKRKEVDRRHLAELVAANAEKMTKVADWGRQVAVSAGVSLNNYQERPGVVDLVRARRGSRDEESLSEGGGSGNTSTTVRVPKPPPAGSERGGDRGSVGAGWTEQVRSIRSTRAPIYEPLATSSDGGHHGPLISARDEKRIHPGVLTVPSFRGKRFYSCCGAEVGQPGCSFPKP